MVNVISRMRFASTLTVYDKLKLSSESTDSCIEFTGRLSADGYGLIEDPKTKQVRKAHRVSYCIANNTLLEAIASQLVIHSCDNRKCINPKHLSLGTNADNMQDKADRGRSADRRGANCPTAKLTPELVREIRVAKGTCIQIGKRYGVSAKCVNNIQRRITWQNVV
jgi:hypothetical protein